MNVENFNPPVTIANPSTGEVRQVRWFNGLHVQFMTGSCRRRDIVTFYGKAAEQKLKALENA